MLSPSELKKRQFARALRGYSTSEVDEHLNFVLEKYTELYQRNDDLEKELARLQAEYDRLKANEDAIRRAMVNAQREERKIIDEANDRASLILRTAKLNTDRMLSEFKAKIREERVTLHKLRRAVREFKENSLKQYQLHLEFLHQISPELAVSDPALEMTEDDYANSLLEQMKLDIESGRVIGEEQEEQSASAPKRGKKADFPEDAKMRTAIFESVKRSPKKVPDSDTKEIPKQKKRADSAPSGDTREIPPVGKRN
ncbi:MAG: DivIVA domain-containing protein [Clostridia bacterium]|nr:DivIVA domain-containing protein [Clostridia bacterium]